jgi:hypothetical protein
MLLRYFVFAVFFPLLLSAQSVTIPLTFRNRTPTGTANRTQTVGIHPLASVGYDEELGEIEIPPFPLPGGIFYVWTVAPTPETVWLSPLDLRPLRSNSQWIDTFNIRASWSGGTLDVTWPTEKPESIDSAYFVDGFTDFPNNVVRAKLWTSDMFSTANPSIDRFRCIVWWNTRTSTLDESISSLVTPSLHPLPVRNVLYIRADAESYEIYNNLGELVIKGALIDAEAMVSVAHLANGLYHLRVQSKASAVGRSFIVD